MDDIARLGIAVDSTSVRGASRDLYDLRGASANAESGVSSLTRQFSTFAGSLVSLYALKNLGTDILNTNREMERLRTQLVSVSGSIESGKANFAFIQKFAEDTPFEIAGLTQSFITLQNFGIKPTTEVMQAITDQASKAGASQETLTGITLALGQAWAKGKLQGQEIMQLINAQVPVWELLTQVTGENTAALQEMSEKGELGKDVIAGLIEKMGELAEGSNARAMDTLNGKISNLSDAWHTFEDTLLQDKSEGIIKNIVDAITNSLRDVTRLIDKANVSWSDFLRFATRGTPSLQALLPAENTGGASGSWGPMAGGATGSWGDDSPSIAQQLGVTSNNSPSNRKSSGHSRSRTSRAPKTVFEELDLGVIDFEKVRTQHIDMAKSFDENFAKPAKTLTEELSQFTIQGARNMQSSFADFLFDPFKKGAKGMLADFIDVIRRMAAEIAASQILGAIGGAAKSGGFGSAIQSIATSFFADGGDHSGGLRVVGERGPELEATGPSRIFNAEQTKNILGGGSGGNVYNLAITVSQGKNDSPESTGTKIYESFIRNIAREEISTSNRPANQNNRVTSFK